MGLPKIPREAAQQIARFRRHRCSREKAMAAFASTPFKGESLPVYVLQRVPARARTTPSRCASAAGPLATDVAVGPTSPVAGVSAPIAAVVLTPTRCAVKTETAMAPTSHLLSPSNRREPAARSISKPSRPSLSEQLKSISSNAESITSQLRSCYKLNETTTTARGSVTACRRQLSQASSGWQAADESPTTSWLLETTTSQLSVGRLDCRFPCPVRFAADRCVYLFQHPFEAKEILMVMYFRDMRHVQLRERDRTLRFRVDKPLEQFGEDYKPSNRQHCLRIVFATASETERVKRFLTQYRHLFRNASSEDDENNVPWDERQ
ncbi:hypothetical protein P43SY_003755 [Pythium insidiosum]|uniref:Uncharacterized protein n=1 Tax=Pythium insidiosum TaxID=114742 RepID=A0AAD5LW44_PYTIN|nr:hypothetical protein P43SY_003755 [Pythium insidiosum]